MSGAARASNASMFALMGGLAALSITRHVGHSSQGRHAVAGRFGMRMHSRKSTCHDARLKRMSQNLATAFAIALPWNQIPRLSLQKPTEGADAHWWGLLRISRTT